MFRHMKYVYEVYREGSFSKAAAKLYISQPALSATVRKVEKEYIRTAEKIREMEEEFAGYVSSLNELSAGKLTVGDTYLFSAFVFPEILKTFREPDLLMDKYPLDSELYERRYVKKGHLLLAVPAGFSSNGPARSWSLSLNDIRKSPGASRAV